MRSAREDNIIDTKIITHAAQTAKVARPKRYILRSPQLDFLRHQFQIRQKLVAKKFDQSKLNISQAETPASAITLFKPASPKLDVSRSLFKLQQKLLPKTPEHPKLNVSQTDETASSPSSAFFKPAATEDEAAPYFIPFGCHGKKPTEENPAPRLVAERLINDLRTRKAAGLPLPAFVLLLGDNFYDDGINRPDSPLFKEFFEKLYGELTELGIPCFAILGNHDVNLHRGNVVSPLTARGIEQGLHQVAASYLPKNNYATVEEMKTLYGMNTSNDQMDIELPLDKLPLWNMPNRYYSLDMAGTEIFCIDSNTYFTDYLEYLVCLKEKKTPDPNNQAVWLARESVRAKAEGKQIIFAQHHPLLTPGKRAAESDSTIYIDFAKLSPEQIKIATELFPGIEKGLCFSDLLKAVYIKQELKPDLILNAHDHMMYYVNVPATDQEPELRQACLGGGGSRIQHREQWTMQNNLAAYMQTHGYGEIITGREYLKLRMHSADNQFHLEFANNNRHATRDYANINKEECEQIKKFCDALRTSLDAFFSLGGGNKDNVVCAHDLWSYISNKKVDSLSTTVNYVKNKLDALIKNNQSLFASDGLPRLVQMINQQLNKTYANEHPGGFSFYMLTQPPSPATLRN